MTAAQPDLDVDAGDDGDAVRDFLARLLAEVRDAEAAAQQARARAQRAADRVRQLREQAREGSQ